MLRQRVGPLPLVAILWAAAVGSGFLLLDDYSTRPAASAPAPVRWPENCRLGRKAGAATLLMFVHPRCPCSAASIDQLRWVLERTPLPVSAYVVLVAPPGAPVGWDQTALRERATCIPGVTVELDVDGAEARRFDALVSGQTLLYDAEGALSFAGGLTAGRGHQGENPASDKLLAQLTGRQTAPHSCPVFGCSFSNQSVDDAK